MLVTGILLSDGVGAEGGGNALTFVLLVYDLWAGLLLWSEARGRPLRWSQLHPWIDITWTGLLIQLDGAGTGLIILTAVQPVVLMSIGVGVQQGVLLSLYLALWVLLRADPQQVVALRRGSMHLAAAVAVLALVPLAALLARPMSVLRQRLGLMRDLESRMDPRRGLQSAAITLVDGLRTELQCDLTGVVLPAAADGPAVLCTFEDGAFTAKPEVHAQIEALLRKLPDSPLTHQRRRGPAWLGGTRLHGPAAQPLDPGLRPVLDELCQLLEVREILVVPFTRYQQRHGHLLLGCRQGATGGMTVDALVDAAPEIFRILEQAALVDRLVRETSAHERVRIGRDLHDSAIQPYLGLKFALEALVRRIPHDNPVRPEVRSLTQLVEAEITSLREIVSGLRNGEPTGDNALLPAVRRQLRHFSELFGIEVQLDAPAELRTSRALAGAVFHMVNEALNNVRKHTPAHNVHVRLALAEGWLRLSVRDDGATVSGQRAAEFLPRSLAERARELGGTLAVTQADGLDTEIVISIPMDAAVRP